MFVNKPVSAATSEVFDPEEDSKASKYILSLTDGRMVACGCLFNVCMLQLMICFLFVYTGAASSH
jgi:hypothetical protein